MRLGLIAVGVAIAVVGASVLITVVLYPPPVEQTSVAPFSKNAIEPRLTPKENVTFPSGPSSQLELWWYSSVVLWVAFYDAQHCPNYQNASCPGDDALEIWTANVSGNWIGANPVSCPCYLLVWNPGKSSGNISGTMVALYAVSGTSLSTWSYTFTLLASLILLGIGGVAVFLGLFLRPGVYAMPPPPPTSRSAEDVEELGNEDPPEPP